MSFASKPYVDSRIDAKLASSGITPGVPVSGGGPDTPGSTTDNAVVRWDGAAGAAIQDSSVTVSDAGQLTWGAGLGSITQVLGPTDNALLIQAGGTGSWDTRVTGGDYGGPVLVSGGGGDASNAGGGTATVQGGSATSSTPGVNNGGDARIFGGTGQGAGTSGAVVITGGASGTATGGAVTVTSGNGGSSSGNSGAIDLITGTVVSGSVGTVSIKPGGNTKFSADASGVLFTRTCVTSIATAGGPNGLTAALTGLHLDNVGAAGKCFYTLPAWARGLHYSATVISTQGIRFTTLNDASILGPTVISTITSGYIESVTFGSHLSLTGISSGYWGVTQLTGSWDVV